MMSKETRIGYIVVETPIVGQAGDFYVSTVFKTEEQTEKFPRKEGYCYDVIPLHWYQKPEEEVDAIMETIPIDSKYRWCGGEYGPCACMGCVQIWNRVIMWEEHNKEKFRFDPEYIDERQIPEDIYNKYKITRDEWESWVERHPDNRTEKEKRSYWVWSMNDDELPR